MDGDPITRSFIEETLSGAGALPYLARDREDARLTLTRIADIELVLIDLTTSRWDCMHDVEQELGAHKEVRLVYMRSGFGAHYPTGLQKPLTATGLLRHLEAILGSPGW